MKDTNILRVRRNRDIYIKFRQSRKRDDTYRNKLKTKRENNERNYVS